MAGSRVRRPIGPRAIGDRRQRVQCRLGLFGGDGVRSAILVDDDAILVAVVADQKFDAAAEGRREGTKRAVRQYLSVDHWAELRPPDTESVTPAVLVLDAG